MIPVRIRIRQVMATEPKLIREHTTDIEWSPEWYDWNKWDECLLDVLTNNLVGNEFNAGLCWHYLFAYNATVPNCETEARARIMGWAEDEALPETADGKVIAAPVDAMNAINRALDEAVQAEVTAQHCYYAKEFARKNTRNYPEPGILRRIVWDWLNYKPASADHTYSQAVKHLIAKRADLAELLAEHIDPMSA